MRLLATFAILIASTSFAHAADDCRAWTAAMEEDEGGPAMTARICSGTGNAAHEFFMRCGAANELMIRFIPVAPKDYPPNEGNYQTELEFLIDGKAFTRKARYEDMDGALATYTSIDDSLLTMLTNEKRFDLSDVNGKVPSATFTLKGAKKALGKLIATCEK